MRRRPSNPSFHCWPCLVSEFCFLALFVSFAFSLFFRSFCNSSRHRSPFALALFSGAAAAAAGRGSPPPPTGRRGGMWLVVKASHRKESTTSKERGGGWGSQIPAPAPPGAAFCGREQQGGLGRPQLPAPAPPGAAFAIPLERNGASGGWGPDVRNGALVQARAHLLKNHALACTRARFPHLMRSKSPRAVWGLGAGRAKWCSGAGEGASFQKSCSRLRQSMFFTSHVCQCFFKGAAAAAAGRGSPPPPGAGVWSSLVGLS